MRLRTIRTAAGLALAIGFIAAAPARSQTAQASEDRQLQAVLAVVDETAEVLKFEAPLLGARASRLGDSLILKLENGRSVTLQDDPCPFDEPEGSCGAYRLAADLPSRHAYLVVHSYAEITRFLLIDDRAGRRNELPAAPVFGPGSAEFVTIDNDEAYGQPGIAVWKWSDGRARMAWRRGAEADPVYHLSRVARWTTPDTVELELWCADIGECPAHGGPPDTHWTGRLVRQGGWRLEAQWP